MRFEHPVPYSAADYEVGYAGHRRSAYGSLTSTAVTVAPLVLAIPFAVPFFPIVVPLSLGWLAFRWWTSTPAASTAPAPVETPSSFRLNLLPPPWVMGGVAVGVAAAIYFVLRRRA